MEILTNNYTQERLQYAIDNGKYTQNHQKRPLESRITWKYEQIIIIYMKKSEYTAKKGIYTQERKGIYTQERHIHTRKGIYTQKKAYMHREKKLEYTAERGI